MPGYGYFGMDSSENNFQYDKEDLTLAGYPGVKNKNHPSNVSMWQDTNKALNPESPDDGKYFIFYAIETARGNSGSPVFKQEGNGRYYAVGVHYGEPK